MVVEITPEELAKLKKDSEWGVNWAWFQESFTSDEADAVLLALDSAGDEHRGKYPQGDGTYHIRWR